MRAWRWNGQGGEHGRRRKKTSTTNIATTPAFFPCFSSRCGEPWASNGTNPEEGMSTNVWKSETPKTQVIMKTATPRVASYRGTIQNNIRNLTCVSVYFLRVTSSHVVFVCSMASMHVSSATLGSRLFLVGVGPLPGSLISWIFPKARVPVKDAPPSSPRSFQIPVPWPVDPIRNFSRLGLMRLWFLMEQTSGLSSLFLLVEK
jgi:hypothetical protein